MTERDLHQDDIILSAYLDGELPPQEAEALTRRLATEPALLDRLAALRAGDEATRQAFANLDHIPLPPGVLDLLEDQENLPGTSEADNIILPFRSRAARAFLQYPVAIAASLALALGFIISLQLPDNSAGQPDSFARYDRAVQPGSELFQMLESGLSTQPIKLASGAVGRLKLTFQDSTGGYCRQFQVDGPSSSMQAVACRHDDQWTLQVSTFAAPAAPPSPGSYQPATGATPAAIDAAIESLIGDKPPVNAEIEVKLVNSGWSSE